MTAISGLRYIYTEPTAGSALKRLFIDSVIARTTSYQVMSHLLDAHDAEIPRGMMKDLILALKKSLEAAPDGEKLNPLSVKDYLVPEQ